MRYVTNGNGELVVISRSGEIVINDAQSGRERERHKVPYGATLLCSLGSEVKAGQQLATFDPMTLPIVSEYAGTVRFENVVENVTVMNQVDEVTGLSSMVVIDPKRSAAGSKSKGTKTTAANVMRPVVHLVDENGNDVKIPGTDHTVTIQLPRQRHYRGARRSEDSRRRNSCPYPARKPEDPRHYGGLPPCGRAL